MFFWKKLCSCTYRTLQRICVYMKKNQSPRRLKNHNLICSDNLYIKIIIKFKVWNKNIGWTVVTHAFDPSTWEEEVGRFLSSRPAWSTEWVPGHPELHRETLSQKSKKHQKQTNKKKKPTKQTKKSTDCSSRGLEFKSQQPHGGSQPSVMRSDALFWCVWRQLQYTYI